MIQSASDYFKRSIKALKGFKKTKHYTTPPMPWSIKLSEAKKGFATGKKSKSGGSILWNGSWFRRYFFENCFMLAIPERYSSLYYFNPQLIELDAMTRVVKLVKTVVLSAIILVSTGCAVVSEDIGDRHFKIYRGDGHAATFEELLNAARESDVTFLGEIHDDPVAHHLEEKILKELWQPNLTLSLEMFETDVQYIIDEYLAGHIREDHMIKSGRAWKYYETDYKPLIEFVKEKQSIVIAANPPRRYVNMVSRNGQEALLKLSDQSKAYLPPLPYALATESYAKKFNTLMSENNRMQRDLASEAELTEKEKIEKEKELQKKIEQTLQAQSLWDAGMAWSIAQHLNQNPNNNILHVNGSFHSAERMGILDHLTGYRPGTSMLVVTMVAADSFPEFDQENMLGKGDFVIVTDPTINICCR